MLDQSIINALQKGGTYIFTILVRSEYEGKICPPNFLPRSKTDILRDDSVNLEENDILDKDIQEQLENYFKENHLKTIKFNGKVV